MLERDRTLRQVTQVTDCDRKKYCEPRIQTAQSDHRNPVYAIGFTQLHEATGLGEVLLRRNLEAVYL